MRENKSIFMRFIGLSLVALMVFSGVSYAANYNYPVSPVPKVTVDGNYVHFDQQPLVISGRLLLPIRAVCERMGAEVTWDPSKAMTTINSGDKQVVLINGSKEMVLLQQGKSSRVIALDVPPQIYKGRTLLPLRAVVEALDYQITWNAKQNSAQVVEAGSLAIEGLSNTQVDYLWRWATISPVQQFAYKDLGLAYAYKKDNFLYVQTPEKLLKTPQKYPRLGDVIADSAGNIYVVWGKENETKNQPTDTTFISKYNSDGQHLASTGFEGSSSPWGSSNLAKTQIPFNASGSVSVISNGTLINYHGKQRYDGHQSDQAIAVSIDTMQPVNLENNTFAGHSFAQSILHYEKGNKVLFASQGDAFPRGFKVNDLTGLYGQQESVLFHFFMPSNVNYDMGIVNETYAQLGGIAETSQGLVLVGASAKSLSATAASEGQNLFVQLFDPDQKVSSSSKFIGGTERTGATALDIYDTASKPLVSITDYGTHWLTDYKDSSVLAPQVVVANDRIIILWSVKKKAEKAYFGYPERDNSYYMVLSATGEVLLKPTHLGNIPLNSMEKPIYHDGHLEWVSVYNGFLKVRKLLVQ